MRETRASRPIPNLLEEQRASPGWGQASSSWFLGFSHRGPPACELYTDIYLRDYLQMFVSEVESRGRRKLPWTHRHE